MRKIKRLVAHKRMEKAGVRRINKRDYFSKHWREYVDK